MTRGLNFEVGTKFGKWLRDEPALDSKVQRLSIQNLDYIVHGYARFRQGKSCQAVMLVEEKTRNGKVGATQRDTHGVIDQMLRVADGCKVNVMRGSSLAYYFGYHTLVFERETPDDGRMWWDGALIDYDTLIKVLRFEVDPRSIAKRN